MKQQPKGNGCFCTTDMSQKFKHRLENPQHQLVLHSWEQVQSLWLFSTLYYLCVCAKLKFTGTPSKRNKEIGRPAKLLYDRRKIRKTKKWRYSDGGSTHTRWWERKSKSTLIIENHWSVEEPTRIRRLGWLHRLREGGYIQSTDVTCIRQRFHSRTLIENGERRWQQRK